MTTGEVLLQYQQRFHELQAGLANIQSKQWVVLSIAVLAVVMTVGFGLLAHYRKTIPIWYPPLAIPIAVISIRNYGRLRLQADRLKRLSDFYARGKARLAGQWAGKGHSGSEFQPADHPYATDLGVFGEGSLFERICTARTHLGRERLAGYLAEPVGREEAQGRQGAVRELACKIDLREKVALLGKYDFEESRWQTFAQWLDTPSTQQRSKLLRLFFCASSLLLLAMSIAVLIAPSALGLIFWRPICTLAAVQALVAGFLLRWVRVTLAAAAPVANEIKVMREGMTMLSGLKFSAPKLVHLARSAEGADLTIEELDPWFLVLAERSKDWMYQLSIWFALGTQTALALDAWRGRHRTALLRWLDTWAEFEALSALACYAYENPEDCWPEITEACAFLEADALGHPLLARDTCVPNDVVLGYGRKFWVISGSNMSGKSTLLRSMGLASVLALAGAPVRAKSVRMAAMSPYASISLGDSLREGRSRFLAEVQRLRLALDASLQRPVFFLIDEIFSGTNSRDRQLAADAVVRTLVNRGAVGAISTHDIALACIADHGGANVHMASTGRDPLDFDYRIKEGVTQETNAIAIARMAGVPV